MKKSYVFAGASGRGLGMFAKPLKEDFSDCAELKGVYDINVGRSRIFSEKVGNINVYEDFDKMIETEKPDVVIVTTVDAYHSDYIIRAMELGCDVITEKPMTTDEKKCKDILETEKRTGKKVIVTFNYRYAPFSTKIKSLIKDGAIGEVNSIQFEWLLDKIMNFGAHGTSYFRRWNSRMEKSSGLLVHKSTHHFDLINWWLDVEPKKVAAFGELREYGAKNFPFEGKIPDKCETCTHTKECKYYYELGANEIEYYRNNEKYDGYYKDGCIYASDIDIYDTMAVNVSYTNGVMLSYALNATTAYEGWRMSINGTAGRMEAFLPETGVQSKTDYNSIKVFDLENNITEYKISKSSGGHGGGDERLREMLFRGYTSDPLGHSAGTKAGANSILIGVAANKSIKESKVVDIEELIEDKSLMGRK